MVPPIPDPEFQILRNFSSFEIVLMKKSQNLELRIRETNSLLSSILCCPCLSPKVSLLGVDSLWGDCTFIPADWGS